MRISDQQTLNNALRNLQSNQERLSRSSERATTGLEVARPSDDPAAYNRAADYQTQLTRMDGYDQNISLVRARLASTDSTTQSMQGVLTRLRELALGALMGFLPCMIPAWALSQAALTRSPFPGALFLLLLIVLTTPVLLISTQLPRLLGLLPDSLRVLLPRLFPAVSGVWLILIGGAGLGLWPHAHLAISLFGHPFLMMLF